MEKLFSEPLFYIFFIYGMSFMVMANLVVGGITGATSITLVSSFYMLAFFGLTHGMAELSDWANIILKTIGGGETDTIILYTAQICMIVSFLFLLQFGINLMTYKSEKKWVIRSIPIALFAVYIISVLVLGISDIRQIGLIGRYSFGFIGSLLSAVTLFMLANSMKMVGNQKLTRGLNVAAVGFACYAIFGGLITVPVLGLPVQLFRAACAVTITYAASTILDVFQIE